MNVVVDENVPGESVDELRLLGHDVFDVRGTIDQSSVDDRLWRIAQSRRALIISTDKAFSGFWREDHFGILVVRLRQPNRVKIHERIMRAMRDVPESDWPGLLVVMRDRAINTRRRPPDGNA